jgi:hypothetical protein
LWHISAPDPREGSVELGYVRQDARGRLPGVPLPIGVFPSATEAMLAVELYESALASGQVPGVPIGKGGVARVLAHEGDLVIERTETDLLLVGEGPDGVRFTIARLHRPGPRGEDGFGAFERPPASRIRPGSTRRSSARSPAYAPHAGARRCGPSAGHGEEFRAWRETRGAGDAEDGCARRH